MNDLASRWVALCARHSIAVLVLAAIGSVAALQFTATRLGVNTDTADMISPQLEWRRDYIDYQRQFPQFTDTLVVVVDATDPGLADEAARGLAAALSMRSELFDRVSVPGAGPFFERQALLYLDTDALAELADELTAAQPLLGRLHRDPSLAAVFTLLAEALEADHGPGPRVLERFAGELADAVDAVLAGRAEPLSWRRLLAGGAAGGGAARRLLLLAPHLEWSQLFPAEAAIEAVHSEARALALTPENGVRVRVTGDLAMSDEELRSVSRGAGRAAVLALIGVAVVLALGLGSTRLVLNTLVTLLLGLLWTATFAAAAVGHLNMISLAFAVLYIGLGVDYSVHFGLHYRARRRAGLAHEPALASAGRDVGTSLALCALTTGVGFFAFVPTRFAGVSELGLIAGVGTFVSLAATLSLMPALLTLTGVRVSGGIGAELAPGAWAERRLGKRPGRVLLAAAVLAAAASASALSVRFDYNPLNLRSPDGEAVSTYRELLAERDGWALEVLVSSEREARDLSRRLETLPSVSGVVSLASYVPPEQDAKVALVADLALLLGPDLSGPPGAASTPPAARAPLARLQAALAARERAASPELNRLARSLARLADALAASDAAAAESLLDALQRSATRTLPEELRKLGLALDARAVSASEMPGELRRDWVAPDGRRRLRVDAADDLNRRDALERFVEQVRSVAPAATGDPVVLLEAGRVVVGAFVQAFVLALVCVAAILMLTLRRGRDALVVLLPLLLAALFAVGALGLLGSSFNFANVIALPLLLGIGVDGGIHMLMRARRERGCAPLAGSTTARGVLISALTTVVSFGNLAFSPHPGTSSMGLLLTIGMLASLACTLAVLPALASALGVAGAAGRTRG